MLKGNCTQNSRQRREESWNS